MTQVSLPNTSKGTSDDNLFSDCYGNDLALATVVSGQLQNDNIKSDAAISHSKLASMSTGAVLLGNAGTPTSTTLSGDATVSATGAVSLATAQAIKLGITEQGSAVPRRAYAAVATDQSTSSTSYTSLSTAGPTVTLTVPANSLVMLMAQVDIKVGATSAQVTIYEDLVDIGDGNGAMSSTNTGSFVTTYSGNTTNASRAAAIAWSGAAAGSHAYTLLYKTTNAGTASHFQNRKLWAWVVGF